MNSQEIEQALSLHTREISEIRSTLAEVTTKLDQVSDKLDQVAAQQDANMQQIAQNAEGITGLRILMEEYFRRSSGN
ncbi:hypothetical protein K9N68_15760 [Kovacikia minuta CCNUW1]|uniref:hypothetical protein n=1 Tax=Kovacikia minuta TaxID=2931930 RepID=UPI001CCEF76B|nr:hypothetical protein [Kovacikia minuta]UBF29158.1 hypothetical protein K9N68_15760 [Kovacikia minuta CCNUW1]